MRDLPKSMRPWLLSLAILLGSVVSDLIVAADRPATATPERLIGKKSYWIQEAPFLTKSAISAKFVRPRSAQQLLRNLYVVWTQRLLVEPAFYDDSVLMACFDGTAVTWKDRSIDPNGKYSNRQAEITLDARTFPYAFVVVRLYRREAEATKKPQPYFPAHQHYIGFLDLSVKGIKDLTWQQVTSVFGKRSPLMDVYMDVPGADTGKSDTVAQMRYSYPGDDPAKFGFLELPQTTFSLSRMRPDAASSQSRGPQDSDNVTRVFMLQAVNRVQGEK